MVKELSASAPVVAVEWLREQARRWGQEWHCVRAYAYMFVCVRVCVRLRASACVCVCLGLKACVCVPGVALGPSCVFFFMLLRISWTARFVVGG